MTYIPYTVIEGAVVYSNLLALLSLGLTITHITTRVTNFAQGALAVLGSYTAMTFLYLYDVHPYASIPAALLCGGAAGLLLYLLVLRPLILRGASDVMLMIATLAVDLVFMGVFGMYAGYINAITHRMAARFTFAGLDFRLGHVSGVLAVSTLIILMLLTTLFVLLYRTRFGVALRASMENPDLAQSLGINVEQVRLFSWFLSGLLAGIAGCILPFRQEIYPGTSGIILPSVFAASIVGGFESIYGALVGSYVIGLSESLIPYALTGMLGYDIMVYGKAISLAALAFTLIFAPRGIMGVSWSSVINKVKAAGRLVRSWSR